MIQAIRLAEAPTELAKQIIAYYGTMVNATPTRGPTPVWVVQAWGIPPFAMYGRGAEQVPVDQRNHLRTVIDAETGERYSTDNFPFPETGR